MPRDSNAPRARGDATDRFVARAREVGLDPSVQEFPVGTRTAADAAAAIGCEVAQIVKSLVFVTDTDRPVLALVSGANRVDERKLAAALGVHAVRKATADEVRAATGYAIGGTPPVGHDTSMPVLCDRDLAAHEQVWAAAGSPRTVFAISPSQLLESTGAAAVDLAA